MFWHPIRSRPISSWQDAEARSAEWMRAMGFTDARVTPSGPDGGIDVIASAALAQVKAFAKTSVGVPAVQQLVGARGRDQQKQLLFFTSSSFTRRAVEYANTMDVALYRMNLHSGMLEALNRPAVRIMSDYQRRLREHQDRKRRAKEERALRRKDDYRKAMDRARSLEKHRQAAEKERTRQERLARAEPRDVGKGERRQNQQPEQVSNVENQDPSIAARREQAAEPQPMSVVGGLVLGLFFGGLAALFTESAGQLIIGDPWIWPITVAFIVLGAAALLLFYVTVGLTSVIGVAGRIWAVLMSAGVALFWYWVQPDPIGLVAVQTFPLLLTVVFARNKSK